MIAHPIDDISKLMENTHISPKKTNVEIAEKLFQTLSLNKKKTVTNKCQSNPRHDVFLKFNEILQNEAKSKNLEISIFNWTIGYIKNNKIHPKISKRNTNIIVNNNDLNWNNNRFKRAYLAKYRSISFNLKNPKNTKFKENVIGNIIATKSIVNLKPEEIYPDVWEAVFQRQIDKELIRLKNEGKELAEALEGNYTCNKCKCKKVTYYELQTRSADEPMTAYFTCLNCGNHWKE